MKRWSAGLPRWLFQRQLRENADLLTGQSLGDAMAAAAAQIQQHQRDCSLSETPRSWHCRSFCYTWLISQVVQKERNLFPEHFCTSSHGGWQNWSVPCPVAMVHPYRWGFCSPWAHCAKQWDLSGMGVLTEDLKETTSEPAGGSPGCSWQAVRDRSPSEDSHSTTIGCWLFSSKFLCMYIYIHREVTVLI